MYLQFYQVPSSLVFNLTVKQIPKSAICKLQTRATSSTSNAGWMPHTVQRWPHSYTLRQQPPILSPHPQKSKLKLIAQVHVSQHRCIQDLQSIILNPTFGVRRSIPARNWDIMLPKQHLLNDAQLCRSLLRFLFITLASHHRDNWNTHLESLSAQSKLLDVVRLEQQNPVWSQTVFCLPPPNHVDGKSSVTLSAPVPNTALYHEASPQLLPNSPQPRALHMAPSFHPCQLPDTTLQIKPSRWKYIVCWPAWPESLRKPGQDHLHHGNCNHSQTWHCRHPGQLDNSLQTHCSNKHSRRPAGGQQDSKKLSCSANWHRSPGSIISPWTIANSTLNHFTNQSTASLHVLLPNLQKSQVCRLLLDLSKIAVSCSTHIFIVQGTAPLGSHPHSHAPIPPLTDNSCTKLHAFITPNYTYISPFSWHKMSSHSEVFKLFLKQHVLDKIAQEVAVLHSCILCTDALFWLGTILMQTSHPVMCFSMVTQKNVTNHILGQSQNKIASLC